MIVYLWPWYVSKPLMLLGIPLAVLLHEAGHALAARMCGVRFRYDIRLLGPYTVIIQEPWTDAHLFWISLAGPAINLLLCGLCLLLSYGTAHFEWAVWGLCHFINGVGNPVYPNPKADGWVAWSSLRAWWLRSTV